MILSSARASVPAAAILRPADRQVRVGITPFDSRLAMDGPTAGGKDRNTDYDADPSITLLRA
jgi:hypothetical protein